MWKSIKINKRLYMIYVSIFDDYIDIYYSNIKVQQIHTKYLNIKKGKKILIFDEENKHSRFSF